MRAAADAWLALIDSGQYRRSWEEAAVQARSVFPADQWVGFISALRSRLGALRSREHSAIQFGEVAPGAPPGEYVLLEYRSAFGNDPEATERVTLLKENGTWRGFSYSVQD